MKEAPPSASSAIAAAAAATGGGGGGGATSTATKAMSPENTYTSWRYCDTIYYSDFVILLYESAMQIIDAIGDRSFSLGGMRMSLEGFLGLQEGVLLCEDGRSAFLEAMSIVLRKMDINTKSRASTAGDVAVVLNEELTLRRPALLSTLELTQISEIKDMKLAEKYHIERYIMKTPLTTSTDVRAATNGISSNNYISNNYMSGLNASCTSSSGRNTQSNLEATMSLNRDIRYDSERPSLPLHPGRIVQNDLKRPPMQLSISIPNDNIGGVTLESPKALVKAAAELSLKKRGISYDPDTTIIPTAYEKAILAKKSRAALKKVCAGKSRTRASPLSDSLIKDAMSPESRTVLKSVLALRKKVTKDQWSACRSNASLDSEEDPSADTETPEGGIYESESATTISDNILMDEGNGSRNVSEPIDAISISDKNEPLDVNSTCDYEQRDETKDSANNYAKSNNIAIEQVAYYDTTPGAAANDVEETTHEFSSTIKVSFLYPEPPSISPYRRGLVPSPWLRKSWEQHQTVMSMEFFGSIKLEKNKIEQSPKCIYRGLKWLSHIARFEAQIHYEGKDCSLGYFDDPVEGALSYDMAVRCIAGPKDDIVVNFDSPTSERSNLELLEFLFEQGKKHRNSSSEYNGRVPPSYLVVQTYMPQWSPPIPTLEPMPSPSS